VPLRYPSTEEPWSALVLVGCQQCGFSHVPTVPFSLDDYYRSEYGATRRSRTAPPSEFFTGEATPGVERQRRRADRHLEVLQRFSAEFGTVLDVGCGPGIFLHRVPAKRKLAIEPDPLSKPYLDYLGAQIVRADDIPDASVDVVVTSHFLEHLLAPDLAGMLATFRRVLKPAGLVLSEVPQGSLMAFDLSRGRHAPHISFFSPESLERVFTDAGFDVCLLDTMGGKPAAAIEAPLYAPTGDDLRPVYTSGRGSLTIVGRKGADATD
jgi:SAM-dependent methyltransferase